MSEAKKRKIHGSEFKAKVGLEALRGVKTINEIAQEFGVHPVQVGERDVECPPAQSTEFWHGLKAMGTPTSLVIYDGEGHSLRKPENQRDQRARTVAWFERYLR